MVFTCSEEEESMAMGPERSNSKPLHNFMLPYLKWGTQRHLRCTKLPSDAAAYDAGDRRSPALREFHPSPPSNATRLPQPRFLADEGINAVREKLTLDFKTEADRMKDAILGKEVADDNDNDARMEDAPPPPPQPEEQVSGVRTWNLRTRRAPVAEKGMRIDERKGGSSSTPSPLRTYGGGVAGKSLKLRGSPEKEERPVKFSLTLSKKDIEEDFMKIVGHRPPRRPKRRPRNVQKQLDTLFPGQWLSEVSADSYKVPDDAETGKR